MEKWHRVSRERQEKMSKENQEKPLCIQRMAFTKEQGRFIWGHIKRNSKLINLFGALCEVGMRSEKYKPRGRSCVV